MTKRTHDEIRHYAHCLRGRSGEIIEQLLGEVEALEKSVCDCAEMHYPDCDKNETK